MSLPSDLHDKANLEARVWVSTAEGIDDVELLARELLGGNPLKLLPSLLTGGLVVVGVLGGGPPDGVAGCVIEDEELVLWRAARVDARHHVDSAQLGELSAVIARQVWL